MFAFISAAFPWILLGLAIAFYISKRSDTEIYENTYMREGFFLGASFGIILSFLGIMNFAMMLSLGAFLGEIAGMYIKRD